MLYSVWLSHENVSLSGVVAVRLGGAPGVFGAHAHVASRHIGVRSRPLGPGIDSR
jgi:hypothetical protein